MTRTLLLTLAGLVPQLALAAEPMVSLDVDVSALPDNEVTVDLRSWLVEHQTEVLRDHGIGTSDDTPTQLRLIVSRYGDGDIHYRTTIVLIDQTTGAIELERTIRCELCRDTDLNTMVGDELARLSDRLWPIDSDGLPIDPPESEEHALNELDALNELNALDQAVSEPDPRGEPNSPARARRIGWRGAIGIATLGIGASTTTAGITLAARSERTRLDDGNVVRRNTRPAGLALVGVGSALLVTGAVLVGRDVVRRRRRHDFSFTPTVAPATLTIQMSMRF
ncbi:MAG: hypothetical protein AAGF11_50985 [Myxococcota bacterium]